MLEPKPCVIRRELFKAGDSGGVLLGFAAAEVALEMVFGVNSHSMLPIGHLSRLSGWFC